MSLRFPAAAALLFTLPAAAHHSYALFDLGKTATVAGTIAKVEWVNPHVSVWLYVADPKQPSGYALYVFETSGTNSMMRVGWTKSTFPAGAKVSIDYHPLKDGRRGGSFVRATQADGTVVKGDGRSEGGAK